MHVIDVEEVTKTSFSSILLLTYSEEKMIHEERQAGVAATENVDLLSHRAFFLLSN